MNRAWSGCACAALILVIASPPVAAQDRAEASVHVEFLESEVVLGAGENVTTPLQVTAELDCQPAQAPPDAAIRMWGTHGVAFSGPDGYYYESEATPDEVRFVEAEDGRYIIDETVTMRFWSTVPRESASTHEVVYATERVASNDSCTLQGWSAAPAEGASILLHLEPASAEDPARESDGAGALSFILLAGLALMAAGRRSGRT